jgi:hypothetical protein
MVNLKETSVPVPDRGVEGMLSLEKFVEAIRPWMDQAHVNLVVSDPEMRMVYINPFCLNNFRELLEDMKHYCKAARELTHIKDLVGMDTKPFHRHPRLKELMLDKDSDYAKSFRMGTHTFSGECRVIRDAKGEILGWIDTFNEEEEEEDESGKSADELMIYGSDTINVDLEPKT